MIARLTAPVGGRDRRDTILSSAAHYSRPFRSDTFPVMTRRHLPHALAVGLLLSITGCTTVKSSLPVPEPPPATGTDVLQRMRAKYDGQWFRTMQFTQENTRYLANGKTERSQWQEYMLVPGRLRIEFLPATGGNGAIYADGNVYSFEGGKLARTTPQLNILLNLTADVYAQPVEISARQLTSVGVDLTRLRRETYNGQPVWVVGSTGPTDLGSPQFWVEDGAWVVVRVIDRPPLGGAQGPRPATEYRLADYRSLNGVPVVHDITLLRDGKAFFREQYTEVQLNTPLDARLFSPSQWRVPAKP